MIVREEVGVKLGSTYETLQGFFEGSVWRDLMAMCEDTIDGYRDELEVCRDQTEIAYLQGCLFVLRRMNETPSLMLEAKELELEELEDSEDGS